MTIRLVIDRETITVDKYNEKALQKIANILETRKRELEENAYVRYVSAMDEYQILAKSKRN